MIPNEVKDVAEFIKTLLEIAMLVAGLISWLRK